jgi:hypothetical protein
MSRLALSSRNRFRRRGYTLVFFAMFLFAFMALAALVIDIGFARLTQQQMQTAADSAALEGLRGEDSLDYDDRRAAARQVVAWHFDDDLDASGDDGAFDAGSGQFGAGPLVGFTSGAGDPSLVASQLMEVDPANPVYKPEVLDGPPSAAGTFLVTLRRGTTDVPAADLYANGPAVPYLFARGSLMNRQLIQKGVTVRGTGVAQMRPVLSIGLVDDAITPPLPGLALFALDLTYWNGLTNGSPDIQTVTAGEIGTVGRFFDTGGSDPLPVSIGRPLPVTSNPGDGTYSGYVAIYAAISNGATTIPRIVGYGSATAVVTTGMVQLVAITRQPQQAAAENASAVVCYPLVLSSIELANVLAENANVAESLLAPGSRNAAP